MKIVCRTILAFFYTTGIAFAQNPSSDLVITGNPETCFRKNDGKLLISKSSQKEYIHNLVRDPVDEFSATRDYVNVSSIDNLTPGRYFLISRYTDQNGTVQTYRSNAVTIAAASEIEIDPPVIMAQPSAAQQNGGLISLRIKGGASPYSITQISTNETMLRGSSFSGNAIINGLNNDFYFFEITDSNQCPTQSVSIEMPLSNGLALNPRITQPTCTELTGNIDFNIIGGNAPYIIRYSQTANGGGWSQTTTDQSGKGTVPSLIPGQYTFEITDSSAPAKRDSFRPLIGAANCNLEVVVNVEQQPTVSDEKGGLARVNVKNGKPNFRVTLRSLNEGRDIKVWDEASPTFLVQKLVEGTYAIHITDANNANGSGFFSFATTFPTEIEARKMAKDAFTQLINKYCQVEIKSNRIELTKKGTAIGLNVFTAAMTYLTAGTIQIVTLGFDVIANAGNTFINNENIEALTRGSELLREQLRPRFLDATYFVNYDIRKFKELKSEIDQIYATIRKVDDIEKMPKLKNYKEKAKRRIPEYDLLNNPSSTANSTPIAGSNQ